MKVRHLRRLKSFLELAEHERDCALKSGLVDASKSVLRCTNAWLAKLQRANGNLGRW